MLDVKCSRHRQELYARARPRHRLTMTDAPRDRLEPLRRAARRVPGAMAAGRWLHRRLDPELRAIECSQRTHGPALFQPFPDTCEERYPALFDALAARLALLEAPRILSFGCSSGEEARALRRRLPRARITGIDANARAIARARRADRDPLSRYVCTSRVPPDERFDAILALAVFRHGELEALRPGSCAAILPFARFCAGIAMLDAALEPGGWLAIWNAQFRFADTPAAPRYRSEPLAMLTPPQALLYGPDDRRLIGATYAEALFRRS